VAVCLGIDAFSVALSVGHTGVGPRSAFRLSFHFGLFQFLMPLVGWLLGSQLAGRLEQLEHWVAFVILAAIGAHMLYGAFHASRERPNRDHSRGWTLVGLSFAVSIDALGVGVSIGMLQMPLLGAAIVIGVVAGVMTLVGIALSRRIADIFGRRVEAIGGVALILLAFHLLLL
jgi:putative Mn2+ efflux pump MntP